MDFEEEDYLIDFKKRKVSNDHLAHHSAVSEEEVQMSSCSTQSGTGSTPEVILLDDDEDVTESTAGDSNVSSSTAFSSFLREYPSMALSASQLVALNRTRKDGWHSHKIHLAQRVAHLKQEVSFLTSVLTIFFHVKKERINLSE